MKCNFENNDCVLSAFSSYSSTISGCDFLDGFSGIVLVRSPWCDGLGLYNLKYYSSVFSKYADKHIGV